MFTAASAMDFKMVDFNPIGIYGIWKFDTLLSIRYEVRRSKYRPNAHFSIQVLVIIPAIRILFTPLAIIVLHVILQFLVCSTTYIDGS